MQDWHQAIDRLTDEIFPELVNLRRYLHAHPELSGAEFDTTTHLRHWLLQRGIASRVVADGRGLLVDLGEPCESGRFALRSDTDALQIQDAKTVDYRSLVDGVMHACGHDVHATILAGSLAVLDKLAGRQLTPHPICIRGVFQPAEETCSGALQMVAEQALEGVSRIVACHVDPHRQIGKLGIRSGVMAASCDELIVTVHGQGGHAARPHHTRDPITAAAQFLNAVHVQIPRGADSLDTVVLGFGAIHGGSQSNVIPEAVSIRGSLRTLTSQTRSMALTQLNEIADGVGRASQTKIEVTIGVNAPAVVNDAEMTELVRQVICDTWGADAVEEMKFPSMGGDDFAYYLDHVPGALVRLGTRAPNQQPTGLHTPLFDVDETALHVGVKLLARVAVTS